MPHVSLKLPGIPRLLALARLISACLAPRASCLLWVVEHGVWPTSENWHLYYRLRQSYAEHRLFHEAPGHLFLDYEEPEFVSYLQLVILNGWEVELLPALTYGGAETCRGFISHDEYIVLAHRERDMVGEWRAEFARYNYEMLE